MSLLFHPRTKRAYELKKKLLCSICVANYNGVDFLSSCLDSIFKQDFDGSYEVLVHDDASTDDSVALIKARYPQVQLLVSNQNIGFCVSNNRMVAAAQGDFILLLNNDAVLHTDALKTLYAASAVHGKGIYGLPQYDAASGKLIDIGSIFDPFLNPIPIKNLEKSDVGMIIGACLWLPKSLWDELDGFPDWFGSLSEDMYLCCLARLKGFPVKAISESGFDHWVGKSLGGGKVLNNKRLSTTLTRRAMSERNKTFVMLICYPSLVACLFIPLHLFLLAIEGLLLSAIKRDKRIWLRVYWFSFKEIWRKRLLWLRQRRVVQHGRVCSTRSFMLPITFLPHKLRMLLKYGFPDVK